jgi:hypothetical protein
VALIIILLSLDQRERERRNSDRSEDGYHSDGDYGEHDYRHDISDERESKTIMLRGLPITITESDVREATNSSNILVGTTNLLVVSWYYLMSISGIDFFLVN